jgi:hypothetical protein
MQVFYRAPSGCTAERKTGNGARRKAEKEEYGIWLYASFPMIATLTCIHYLPYRQLFLPGGGKSRQNFLKSTASLGHLIAKFFTHTACFLKFRHIKLNI